MHDALKSSARIIAVCGKGGVGKTSISAMIIKMLSADPDQKILAIDADPAVGLASALGVPVHKTVDDIRNDLIRKVKDGATEDKEQILSRLDYEMFSAIEEKKNFAFLAIGRPENKGCYCQVNQMLKDLIASIARNFDYVVIDGEAGIEQINRRVMEKVSHLIIVSDGSVKGLAVAETIKEIAESAILYEKYGLIINRIRSEKEWKRIPLPSILNCLGWIPEDDAIRDCDMEGTSILNINDCPAFEAVKKCLTGVGLKTSIQHFSDQAMGV